ENRGLHLMLESVRDAVRADPRIVLVVAGADERHNEVIRSYGDRYGIGPNLLTLGKVEHTCIPGILHCSDVCLSFLSDVPAHRLSPPQKVVEYFAAGKPVIANDIATHSLVRDGVNGYIVDEDPAHTAAVIKRLKDDRELLPRLSRNARETAEQFDLDRVYSDMVRRIDAAMTGQDAAASPRPGDSISGAVLRWLRTMQVSATQYKMNETADATIFTSCFALFILHLFRETDKFTAAEKAQWVAHLQSCQDEADGYFKPPMDLHADRERSWHQLTCFCLSALALLDAEPHFPLGFLRRWPTPESIRGYLEECGCHAGVGGSGNKAMFLAIFLTWEYGRTHDERYRSCLEEWFAWHDAHQNAQGFWGNDRKSRSLHGLQNGFHQFLIYFYWRRRLPRLERIVDVALSTQDRDGFFAPTPGGGGCYDYDAFLTTGGGTSRRVCDVRPWPCSPTRTAMVASVTRESP
ncbi:MAG: glycosyltransferase, partial [Planctomycetes bacterium]|nr:glycosyltransferase [Planctomycetota bacterium]